MGIVEEFYDADVPDREPVRLYPPRPDRGHRREDGYCGGRLPLCPPVVVPEAGIIALIERGVRVLTASGDDLTATEDPFKIAMRQIAGVFAQPEKARLVGLTFERDNYAIALRNRHSDFCCWHFSD